MVAILLVRDLRVCKKAEGFDGRGLFFVWGQVRIGL